MAKEAVRSWLTIIDELRNISKPTRGSPSQQKMMSVIKKLQHLECTPALPRASWEFLITNAQVPFKLLEVGRNRPGGLPWVCQPGSWIYALSIFLTQAQQAGAIPGSTISVVSDTAQVNSLSLSIGQQLERAGFLQHLPAVITEAAQQLADLQNRPDVIAVVLSNATASAARCLSPTAWQLMGVTDNVQQLFTLLELFRVLWPQDDLEARIFPALVPSLMQLFVQLMQYVSVCLKQLPDSLQHGTIALLKLLLQLHITVARTVVPVTRNIFEDMPQQQQQAKQGFQQELAQSPSSCQAICLLLVINAYAQMLRHQHAGQRHGHTASSALDNTSSSSSSTTTTTASSHSTTTTSASTHSTRNVATHGSVAATTGRASSPAVTQAQTVFAVQELLRDSWQLACSRHHLLPAAHDELLQALGCSSKAVLMAAAAAAAWPGEDSSPAQLVGQGMQEIIIYTRMDQLKSSLSRQRTQPGTGVQWSAAEQKIHLLLPSVLLLNAAETYSSDATPLHVAGVTDYVNMCSTATACSMQCVLAWKRQESSRLHTSPQSQSSSQLSKSKGDHTAAVHDEQQEANERVADAESHLQLVAAHVDEVLHLSAHYILPSLLDLCQVDVDTNGCGHQSTQALDGSSSGTSHCSSSTSTSTSITTDSSSSSSSTSTSDVESPHIAFQLLLEYICVLSDVPVGYTQHKMCQLAESRLRAEACSPGFGCEGLTAALERYGAAAAAAVHIPAASLSQHAAELCCTLEGYVRMQAARPLGGSLAEGALPISKLSSGVAVLCSRITMGSKNWRDGGLLQAALAAGPGSPQQVQLFGLLNSLLKYYSQLPPPHAGRLTDAVLAAALAAASILLEAARELQRTNSTDQEQPQQGVQQQQSAAVATSAGSACDPAVESPQLSEAPAALQKDTAADSAAAPEGGLADNQSPAQHSTRSMLPWLVLFGRCCSIWAEQLLQGALGQHPRGSCSAYMSDMKYNTILDIFTQRECPFTGITLMMMHSLLDEHERESQAEGESSHNDSNTASRSVGSTVPVLCLHSCMIWLLDPSTSAQLAAAGYDVEQLTANLDAALQIAGAVQEPWVGAAAFQQQLGSGAAARSSSSISAAAVLQLVQQLRALGQALSTLAISSACNNPSCSNVSGPSEAGLVKGSSSTCGGCRTARYCCRACQTQHWKLHKPVCKALAAVRAGSGP